METLFFAIVIASLVGIVAYFLLNKKKEQPAKEKPMQNTEPPAELPVEPEPVRKAESVIMPEPIKAPEPVQAPEPVKAEVPEAEVQEAEVPEAEVQEAEVPEAIETSEQTENIE